MKIIEVPSPNFISGRHTYRPEAIVVHIMEGTLAGTDSWFANRQSKVSAHYGVGKDGTLHRYVQEADTAWHAGRVDSPTWKLIKPGPNNTFVNPNYYTIGIEHEGNAMTEWSDAMYSASSNLIADIAKRHDIPLDRDHIIGHHEIYSVKTCPGFKVDINKLISLAKGELSQVPQYKKVPLQGKAVSIGLLNIRKTPTTAQAPIITVTANTVLDYEGYTDNGQPVYDNRLWYYNAEGYWFWSGGVKTT